MSGLVIGLVAGLAVGAVVIFCCVKSVCKEKKVRGKRLSHTARREGNGGCRRRLYDIAAAATTRGRGVGCIVFPFSHRESQRRAFASSFERTKEPLFCLRCGLQLRAARQGERGRRGAGRAHRLKKKEINLFRRVNNPTFRCLGTSESTSRIHRHTPSAFLGW